MTHSSQYDDKINQRKNQIVSFLRTVPYSTLENLLKNGNIIKNRKYMKQYLDELISEKKVIFVEELKGYAVFDNISEDILEQHRAIHLPLLLMRMIKHNHTISPNGKFIPPKIYPKTINIITKLEYFNQQYVWWTVRQKILKFELALIEREIFALAEKTVKKNHSMHLFNDFTESLMDIVKSFDDPQSWKKKDYLMLLMERRYRGDLIYLNDISSGARPIVELLPLILERTIHGLKSASKDHLKLRKTSDRKHGFDFKKFIPDKKGDYVTLEREKNELLQRMYDSRKYPKTLRGTKKLLDKYFHVGDRVNLKAVEDNVSAYFQRPFYSIEYNSVELDIVDFIRSISIAVETFESGDRTKPKKEVLQDLKHFLITIDHLDDDECEQVFGKPIGKEGMF